MSDTHLSPFPSTHWSMVARARGNQPESRLALGTLLRRYAPALKSYLLANHRVSEDRADDLLQGFMADKVLEQDLIRQADRSRGRFRTFLMTALNRYAISRVRGETAKKRSPGGRAVADADAALAAYPSPPMPDGFDVAWARQVLSLALEQMRGECDAGGRADVWGVFEARVLEPMLRERAPVPLGELVRRFGVTAERASNLLATAKRMFARNLRRVVGEYADGDDDIEDEIRCLRAILSGAGARSVEQLRT
jgi:RNA polymerase sigma-70 factor (ECF subfamily)